MRQVTFFGLFVAEIPQYFEAFIPENTNIFEVSFLIAQAGAAISQQLYQAAQNCCNACEF